MKIEFRDVSASYPLPDGTRRTVLERVSLEINRGDKVYLVGSTGSGKSTFLRLLYMDMIPDRGVACVGDYVSDSITPDEIPFLRRSLGIVFQDFQLLPDRNVYENVAFALHVTGQRGLSVRSRVLNALARVGLSHKQRRFPHELSGGEQQRVVIARAIVNDPWILLADEPTGNLDPTVADEIMKLLLGLHRQGMTLVMATHDYRLVRTFPARTLAFANGTVSEIDPGTLSAGSSH
ncbi:MAG TPA: ATP-binding cassette domain-containing protein [Rhodothermales bacterium]|nr:ATP-binding cassette domain-containing protein [Rhodothermales bacterium]